MHACILPTGKDIKKVLFTNGKFTSIREKLFPWFICYLYLLKHLEVNAKDKKLFTFVV